MTANNFFAIKHTISILLMCISDQFIVLNQLDESMRMCKIERV